MSSQATWTALKVSAFVPPKTSVPQARRFSVLHRLVNPRISATRNALPHKRLQSFCHLEFEYAMVSTDLSVNARVFQLDRPVL